MPSRRRSLLAPLAVSILSLAPLTVQAAWPERPLRIVVPFPAGGPNDVITRVLAEPLSRRLGQPVVIENRPGAGGTIGTEAGAKAAADGYTLTLGSTSSHSLAPLSNPKLGYSPRQSFAPIGLIGTSPTVLLVSTRQGIDQYAAWLALARQRPGQLNYGSSGNGSLNHLIAESFKARTGLFVVHIPYRGTGQAMADLMSGQIDMMFDAVVTAAPQVKAGRVRALAVSGAARQAELAQIPTFDEVGLKHFDASLWLGLFAPSGTPADRVERLSQELRALLADPDIARRLRASGVEPGSGSAKDLADTLVRVEQDWQRVIRERGLKLD